MQPLLRKGVFDYQEKTGEMNKLEKERVEKNGSGSRWGQEEGGRWEISVRLIAGVRMGYSKTPNFTRRG